VYFKKAEEMKQRFLRSPKFSLRAEELNEAKVVEEYC
jgi:hypothetical protein